MESNPFRVIPLLSISSPCRGIIFFRYRERSRGRLIIGAVIEESRVVALMFWDNTGHTSNKVESRSSDIVPIRIGGSL